MSFARISVDITKSTDINHLNDSLLTLDTLLKNVD